ncbi:MAG: hypothetical protein FJ116_02745 [Deltaproteobacteria bacterium]|nr:hypothetical protein [Deltaproteobacteria bacterium]
MKSGSNKLFLIVLMGASFATANGFGHAVSTTTTTSTTQSTNPSQPLTSIDRTNRVFDIILAHKPYREMHPTALRLVSFLSNPPETETLRKRISEGILSSISRIARNRTELQTDDERRNIAAALVDVANDGSGNRNSVNRFAQVVAARGETIKLEEERTARETTQRQRERDQALQNALLQQAAQQALNGERSGGKDSGESGNGNKSQPPEPPKFGENQPKHDSLSEKLEKALNQKTESPDLSSLLNNNNNSFGSGGNKEKKDEKEGFKFDISPKTAKNEVKPVKAAASSEDSAANSPQDPSDSKNLSANPDEFLNGPTSVPQLAQPNPVNPALADGEGGGGAPNGLLGGASGAGSGFGNSGNGAQEIFQGVGQLDYAPLPPPIRKASAELGGEYSGGASEEGYTYSNNSGSSKKEALVNELVFIRDESRTSGKGLMAFVGYQIKDICSKPGALRTQSVCKILKKKPKTEEKISLNK